jgi:hypothetical protein
MCILIATIYFLKRLSFSGHSYKRWHLLGNSVKESKTIDPYLGTFVDLVLCEEVVFSGIPFSV